MKSLPAEILQEIVQYSDTLIRVTLGFPIDKEKLFEEGGPGKVLDEFLRRNGNLEYLKEWIPGECALTYGVNTKDPKKILEIDRVWNANMFSNQGFIFSVNMDFKWGMENICHDVEEPVQYLAITKQWEKIRKKIMSRDCHPRYLIDAPENKLGKWALRLLSIYKGGKADSSEDLIDDCLFHKMYKEAVRIGKESDHDIIPDIIFLHDVKAFKHIGLSDREVQAHESFLDGYPNEDTIWLDDQLEDDLEKLYYNGDGGLSWALGPYYFHNRKLDVMIRKAKYFTDKTKRVIVDDSLDIAIYYEDAIKYPNPSKAIIYDIDTLSMILLFWTKYGSESISIG